MAAGYLVSCVPTEEKHPEAAVCKRLIKRRLLKEKRAAVNFIKLHIDKDDENPDLLVQVFNSNGYLEKHWLGKDAVKEFVPEWQR